MKLLSRQKKQPDEEKTTKKNKNSETNTDGSSNKKTKKSWKERKVSRKDLERKRTIQNVFQYDLLKKNGTCMAKDLNTFSSCFEISDINYQILPDEQQKEIHARYMETLNSLGSESNVQLIVQNMLVDGDEFEKNVLFQKRNDNYSHLRGELNQMLMSKIKDGNNKIITKKYIVYNVVEEYEAEDRRRIEAEKSIKQQDAEYARKFSELGCKTRKLNGTDRLRLMSNIMYPTEKLFFNYDQPGVTTKDVIAPQDLTFESDHFKLDGRWCRIIKLKDYSTELPDNVINSLTQLDTNLTISFNMQVVPRGDDIAKIKNKLAAMEMEVASAQQKAMGQGYDPEIGMPMDLKLSMSEAEEELVDVQQRNQRLFRCQFFIMLNAATKDEMEEYTKRIFVIAKNKTCQMEILYHQQEEGFNACLPLGYRVKDNNRTLTTAVAAIFIPFTSQELMDEGDSLYYGLNALTNNVIMCNRKLLRSPSGWIFGKPGGGKSFAAKREIAQVFLGLPNDELIIIDPENEYRYLAEKLDGEVIDVSTRNNIHINPLDGDPDSGDYITDKANFCQSFVAQCFGQEMTAPQKGTIDAAIRKVALEYQARFQDWEIEMDFWEESGMDDEPPLRPEPPTLKDFWNVLSQSTNPVAQELAMGINMYVNGSYDLFSGQSNVDITNRLTVYNIRDTDEAIKPVAMTVILESLWTRIKENSDIGKRTWIWIDEIYLLFKYEFAAQFLYELFKRARKFGALVTGITQNVSDLLSSDTFQTMLNNSEFVYMLAQAEDDKERLGKLLRISDTQMSYLDTVERGAGVLYSGNGSVIPFTDDFPRNTDLYKAMSTDPNEKPAYKGDSKKPYRNLSQRVRR